VGISIGAGDAAAVIAACACPRCLGNEGVLVVPQQEQEVLQGQRFQFGENWQLFLRLLTEERIAAAEQALRDMLEVADLQGKKFLDIGSGSGLFSLAARRLGASVRSFDYDPQSVACTRELKRRNFAADRDWTIEQGSILDAAYIQSLGQFDIVYSWGVLHHTGAMWQALAHAALPVAPAGRLYLAIYNDQGRASRLWPVVKRAYNKLPQGLKFLVLWPAAIRLWGPTMVRDCLRGKPFATWHDYGTCGRGMSPWRDVVDWVGGYPFEVAKPEQIFNFYRDKGFTLLKLKTCAGGHGCNEFVFANQCSQSSS